MTHITIVSTMIFLAVSVHLAQSQQRVTLPTAYPRTMFNMQICPANPELVGITADIRALLQNEVTPALECRFNGQEAACPATSCSAIAQQQPQKPSGDYLVTNSSGAVVQVYCDLTGECCNGSLGGTRVGNLNLSDPNQTCPEPWREYPGPRRVCGRERGNGSSSVFFPTNGAQYNCVCGRITGYQYGIPEAFNYAHNVPNRTTLETNGATNYMYVDGISITYGYPKPQKHLWTFAGGRSETSPASIRAQGCPCTSINNYDILVPEFDYFCESGTIVSFPANNTLYDEDPLWDGEGCGPTSSGSCQFNNPPWFCKHLNETVTMEIEVHILTQADNVAALNAEDTPIELLELYIL